MQKMLVHAGHDDGVGQLRCFETLKLDPFKQPGATESDQSPHVVPFNFQQPRRPPARAGRDESPSQDGMRTKQFS